MDMIGNGMSKKIALLCVLFCFSFVNANAYEQYKVGNTYAFDIYAAGEKIEAGGDSLESKFPLPSSYRNPLFISAVDWADVLNVKPKKLVEYAVIGINDYNAGALSLPLDIEGSDKKITWVNAALNNIKLKDEKKAIEEALVPGFIQLGLGVSEEHPNWQPYSGKHALYHDELPELNTVMEHEIMHSLGLSTAAQQYHEDKKDMTYYFSENKKDNLSIYDSNLRIFQGSMFTPFDPSKEIKPEKGMAVGKNKAFDIYKYSPYFVGENTIKVLAGKENYNEARQAIIDNYGLTNYSSAYDGSSFYPSVYGLPIHPADDIDDSEIDISHIELRNSFMSHQDYRNWLIPMEAELAVLKDMGYNIHLRKYFGKSYYLDGIKDTYTAGFSEWDGTSYTGNPSNVEQAVGIHIYGDENNITQASDILTRGDGSFGVRIDGIKNTYTVNSGNKINADGKENIGIGVTWGKNHIINVEKNAVVTAKGDEGIAASFDFGTNIFGFYQDQKGSYFAYEPTFDISNAPSNEHNEALIKDFNISGTLEGKKAAIYISDNAHVKNINIKKGAKINGDIISEWNSVKSGYKSTILRKNDSGKWVDVNPKDVNQIYFTNLNFEKDFNGSVKGRITGENETYNTLKLNNQGNLTVSGDEIIVNEIDNTGTINLSNTNETVSVETQTGDINGDGNLNINSNVSVNLDAGYVGNTINLKKDATLSTMNGEKASITINKINSNNGKLSFDLGDKFLIQQPTYSPMDKLKIGQVKIDEKTAEELDDYSETLFTNNTFNLGDSKANIYYSGEKFTISQDPDNSSRLIVKKTGDGVELGDAAADATTANYIVTEKKLTKDAGIVKGDEFTISGREINANGHKGLVVDGSKNKSGTLLETGMYGASDSDLTVKNNGRLLISSQKGNISIGKKDETAITIDKAEVSIDASRNNVDVNGAIQGKNPKNDNLQIVGKRISLNDINNVSVNAEVNKFNLNGTATNTNFELTNGTFKVNKDVNLASNGTNSLALKNAVVDMRNNAATEIPLKKLEFKSDITANIDVDLKTQKADSFVMKNSSDLKTNSFSLNLNEINIMNPEAPLSKEKYEIPFVGKKYNTQELIGNVYIGKNIDKEFMSSIFKYKLQAAQTDDMTGIVLTRGAEGKYSNYNPAVVAAPVAAQLGGYLTQLNSYDEAFKNLDMKMLMTREERLAYKMANLYAAETTTPLVYSETYLPEKHQAGWFRPYTTFEKVDLKNGPKVKNIMYGSYFGYDTPMYESAKGWDSQYSLYVGYNGSHQNYSGNSIYQNGGTLGASGIWYKGDFFTGLTANVGASIADASTMYGSEDFPLLMTGVASKTGYNWELAKGKFIIQPSYLMSYSFVNTFDYTNAAGARISSDPLHAINITPGLKFIGNLKNGWQPYAGVQMVWNIMDKTDFKAQDASLPDMSVKPYIQYGLGVQKRWGERFTGFFQTMVRNGGRNGVAMSAGLRWTVGK